MSENVKFEDTPEMEKVFAAAGIEPETGGDDGNGTDTGTEAKGGDTSTKPDEASKIKGDVGKDSLSSNKDSGKQPGKEKETKVPDSPGDLKLQDGSTVKAGAERRWYEQSQIAKQRLTATQSDLNTLTQKYTNLETSHNTLKETISKIGLEKPEDVASAVTLYKDLSRDPKGTMTKLLAEMKAMGHTFEGIGGAIDTAAIQQLLDRKLTTSEERKGPTKEEADNIAAQEVATFIQQFPDALTQEAHIAALMDHALTQGQKLSLRDAYFMLKERVVNDGYDWAQPLGPQIEARKAAATNKGPDPKPRVPGRGPNSGIPEIDPSKIINPERELDSDSIVRAAMQEAGYKLN